MVRWSAKAALVVRAAGCAVVVCFAASFVACSSPSPSPPPNCEVRNDNAVCNCYSDMFSERAGFTKTGTCVPATVTAGANVICCATATYPNTVGGQCSCEVDPSGAGCAALGPAFAAIPTCAMNGNLTTQ